MKKRMNDISLILALILRCSVLPAQSDYRFQHYTTKDGLPIDIAFSIESDSLGYIWIGFIDRLSRFDGYNFQAFKPNPDDPNRAALNYEMGSFIRDPSGNIWIPERFQALGKPRIITKYDNNKDRFIKYEIDVGGSRVLRYRFEKNSPILWLAVAEKGLHSLNIQTKELKNYPRFRNDSTRNEFQIFDIKDLGNYLLLSTREGLWTFDKLTHKFSRPPCNPEDSVFLYHSPINKMWEKEFNGIWLRSQRNLVKIDYNLKVINKVTIPDDLNWGGWNWDNEERLWIEGSLKDKQGLFRFDPKDNSTIEIKRKFVFNRLTGHSDYKYELPTYALFDAFVDRHQNVWIGTGRGAFRLPNQRLRFSNIPTPRGEIWANGLYRFGNKEYLIVGTRNRLPSSDPSNHVWISPVPTTDLDSIQFREMLPPFPSGLIRTFFKGKENFWVGLSGDGLTGFSLNAESGLIDPKKIQLVNHNPHNPNTISDNSVEQVWQDAAGNIVIAHVTGGLSVVRSGTRYGDEGSVERYQSLPTDSTGLGDNHILTLYPEEKALWVVTSNSVHRLPLKNGVLQSVNFQNVLTKRELPVVVFKTSDGAIMLGTSTHLYQVFQMGEKFRLDVLLDKYNVGAIQEDDLGRLWLNCTEGLVCYDRREKTLIEFSEDDGIDYARSIISGWLHKTSNGLMMVFQHDGISVFDPLSVQVSQEEVWPVLTRLDVNNISMKGTELPGDENFTIPSDINILKTLTLNYSHNNFTLEFSAMEMTAPEKNLYRHKLEGYDKDWIETDYKNRTATYTNLPAGDYTFKVKASNHHGVWSDNERTLKVIILPPPWRTWWAYTGYGLLVMGLLVWAWKNIVKQERLAASLQLAKVEQEKEHLELEKAKEVDKVKTSFFTNISHEFRTPLTLIKGPVQNILERYKDDPKLQEQLKLVQRNSDLLLKLINQLLDLAKLEAGSLKLEKTEGDIFSFVRAITSSFESFARQKNVSIQGNVPEGSYVALFDKDKVEAILINLINNAMKFTPNGGAVIVEANVVNKLSKINIQELTLCVRDTGIGIPADQQQKIFERFHQVSEAHKEVGTGIGLALVKELVALMGGEISVQSEVGKGSEFRVLLPIELVTSSVLRVTSMEHSLIEAQLDKEVTQLETGNAQPGTRNPELATILVVEDNTDLRQFIIDSLGNGFSFLEAENGKQGLDVATSEIPDLIISDVMMPEMDGITMARKIKSDIRTSHILLILLTAKSSEDSKLSGLGSGADDYLTKPFNKNELLLKVRNGVNRQLKLRERLRAELMSTAPKIEVLSEGEKFLNSVKEKILERLSDEQLSVESLADDIGMSRVQLYRKVSGLTGVSVNELIRKLRLQRASQLLQQNWGPVSQVAYEVGFLNLSYFSKVFKEEFGVLPSEFNSIEK
jgi:signal transduction histidine kinase/DNA-binding response OmpR family regulator/ligand-binding sensor domain-containing protein